MRILHANALESPDLVDGVNAAIWTAAREQAAMGHDVGLVLGDPTREAWAFAERHGVQLHVMGPTLRRYAQDLRRALAQPPDVVHLHSTFAPRLAIATELAGRACVPIVATPHGGLRPHLRGDGSWRQGVYARLVERRRLRRAAVVTALLPAEAEDLHGFLLQYAGRIAMVHSPVDPPGGTLTTRDTPLGTGPMVFLGRLDIHIKGIDHLLDIARRMPTTAFELYGEGPDRERLVRSHPPNVSILEPAFRADKAQVLARAGLYLQTSRFEAFGISVGEAMLAGLPCAISETMDLAPLFTEHHLGMVLPTDADEAADALTAALADRPQLRTWAETAAAYAEQHFTSEAVASGYVDAYRTAQHLSDGRAEPSDAGPRKRM